MWNTGHSEMYKVTWKGENLKSVKSDENGGWHKRSQSYSLRCNHTYIAMRWTTNESLRYFLFIYFFFHGWKKYLRYSFVLNAFLRVLLLKLPFGDSIFSNLLFSLIWWQQFSINNPFVVSRYRKYYFGGAQAYLGVYWRCSFYFNTFIIIIL